MVASLRNRNLFKKKFKWLIHTSDAVQISAKVCFFFTPPGGVNLRILLKYIPMAVQISSKGYFLVHRRRCEVSDFVQLNPNGGANFCKGGVIFGPPGGVNSQVSLI